MSDEIGTRLRAARERQGIDLTAVERETKIRERYLRALEEGRWDEMPGEAYARGFLATYGRYLGLDERALLAEHSRLREPRSEPQPIPEEMLPAAARHGGGRAAHGWQSLPSGWSPGSRSSSPWRSGVDPPTSPNAGGTGAGRRPDPRRRPPRRPPRRGRPRSRSSCARPAPYGCASSTSKDGRWSMARLCRTTRPEDPSRAPASGSRSETGQSRCRSTAGPSRCP